MYSLHTFEPRGEIYAPSSKSFAHRYLICAYLSSKRVTIHNVPLCEDVRITIDVLRQIGADIETVGTDVVITRGEVPSDIVELNFGRSGSTMRFMLPILSALGVKAHLVCDDTLMARPHTQLINCINTYGDNVTVSDILGKMTDGEYTIDGTLSSQYVSGMLFAMSILPYSTLRVVGERVSSKYIDMTIYALEQFGIHTAIDGDTYILSHTFAPQGSYTVEGDWSGASYIMSMGAIRGQVTVKGLNTSSLQGDKAIVDILRDFGAEVIERGDITVKAKTLVGTNVDITDIPDLAQAISVVGSYAQGVTRIYPVTRLQYKESDRLEAIIDMLKSTGIRTQLIDDTLIIYGGEHTSACINTRSDHRTTMASAIMSVGVDVTIDDMNCVDKSYTDFWKDYTALGGRYV